MENSYLRGGTVLWELPLKQFPVVPLLVQQLKRESPVSLPSPQSDDCHDWHILFVLTVRSKRVTSLGFLLVHLLSESTEPHGQLAPENPTADESEGYCLFSI